MPERAQDSLSLIQLLDPEGVRRVGILEDAEGVRLIEGPATTYALAMEAIRQGKTLAEVVASRKTDADLSVASIVERGALLPPLDHPDPAHLLITGTGLTHLGSADARNRMHAAQPAEMTDSMKMFQAGLEGGRAPRGEVGAVPEWFFKGTGASLVGPEAPLEMPGFALDGGDEPEVAGLYVVGPQGRPYRLGFALANEFSDHVQERQNYLLLAHSKLRPCAVGPELRVGPLPPDVRGICRIYRGDELVWEKEFLTGEANMSHTISNLEHHHFKYRLFRQPGDAHVHTFGTATLSFTDGIRCLPGDRFEIEADAFLLPLRNRLLQAPSEGWIGVEQL